VAFHALTGILTGFLTGLSLIVAIGAQNAFVLRQGLLRQHRFPVALICALADLLLIIIGILGIGEVVSHAPEWLIVARYGGALFLAVYAALAAHRAWQGERLGEERSSAMSRTAAIVVCLGLTFLNPHVYLDTVVLLGSLANQHGNPGRWEFGAGASLASLCWFFLLAYGAQLLQPLFASTRSWRLLDGGIALTMSIIAINLMRS